MRPLDLEVHSVLDVLGEGEAGSPSTPFRPFYSAIDAGQGTDQGTYYTIRRDRRLLSARQNLHGSRSSYAGSEVFLSLVDRNNAPVAPDLRQLAVTCLCTNRDLPLLMPIGGDTSDFTMEIGAPVQAVRCLVSPTRPRSSAVHGNTAWQLISHLSLTYLSITDRDGADGEGADALRQILRLYADQADPAVARQVEGIRSVASSPVIRRLPGGGQAAIARGLEVTLTMDEPAFEGIGVHPLGAVLSAFFARHVGINSFTETVAWIDGRGEAMRWPMQVGRRPSV
jgi:type VI secretion system protein ImpG